MTTTATTTSTRHQMIFVNLAVTDVAASREFFTALGYAFNEEMCNEGVLALELGPRPLRDAAAAQLLRRVP